MTAYTKVSEFEDAIQPYLSSGMDVTMRQLIVDLLVYSKEKEKEKQEAANRPMRPRPVASAAYFRQQIQPQSLLPTGLSQLVTALIDFVENLEQQIQSLLQNEC